MSRISTTSERPYPWYVRLLFSLKRGIAMSKLTAPASPADRNVFSERERAALEYAEAITDSNRRVSADEFSRLREHFSEDAIIELTALIAFQNMSSKFNAALDISAGGFCTLPQR